MITIDDVKAAAQQIAGAAHHTPVATSRLLNEACGNQLFLKCENLQRAGAFKFRGAFNAISRLGLAEKGRGVVTYSSGNHAQAVALVSRLLGVHAFIVMPSNAPAMKLAATRDYGAEVSTYDPWTGSREDIARTLAAEHGCSVIPPFDHPHIIAGQGTAALELIHEAGPLDYLFVPCGGGGLLSGCAIAAKSMTPSCKVVGVEPVAGDDATRSFRSGKLQTAQNPDTIADGARTSSLGQITFPLVLQFVDEMITVSDADLVGTMEFVWTRMKLLVEPTGVLGLAPLFNRRYQIAGKRIGVILSGGNVDIGAASDWFRELRDTS
jgi:threonine dehydratase